MSPTNRFLDRPRPLFAVWVATVFLILGWAPQSVAALGSSDRPPGPATLTEFLLPPRSELNTHPLYVELPAREIGWTRTLNLEGGPGPIIYLGEETYVVAEYRGGSVWIYEEGKSSRIVQFGAGPNEIESIQTLGRIGTDRFFVYGNVLDTGSAPRLLSFTTQGAFVETLPMSGDRYWDLSIAQSEGAEPYTLAIGPSLPLSAQQRRMLEGTRGAEAARILGEDDLMVHLYRGAGVADQAVRRFHSRMNSKVEVPGAAATVLIAQTGLIGHHDDEIYVGNQLGLYVWTYDFAGNLRHMTHQLSDGDGWGDGFPENMPGRGRLAYRDLEVDENGIVFLASANVRYPHIVVLREGGELVSIIGGLENNARFLSAHDGRLVVSDPVHTGTVFEYDYSDYIELWTNGSGDE